MANALKDLFTNIATSIRGGLPDEGAMSPSVFPKKIDEIVAQMGTGGGENTGLFFKDVKLMYSSSFVSGDTISGYTSIQLPKDAVIVSLYARIKCKGVNSSGTVGTSSYFKTRLNPDKELEIMNEYNNMVTYKLFDYEYTCSGATTMSISESRIDILCKSPNAYIENNVLHAGENCKGLFANVTYDSSALINPYYIEAIDMRGSQILKLPEYAFVGHDEIKKVWLPECLASLNSENLYGCEKYLEELHFTSTTPTKLTYDTLKYLNTACKIYVPTGYLEAYTSQTYAPSASKYTYIEE